MPGRATLVSVARAAGVSRQTVSNVLNAPELVSPDTAAKVQRVIDEQGYRTHTAARQMRTSRSQIIGLRIEPVRDGVNGVVLDRFLHALTASAEAADHRVMLFTADDDASEIRAYQELVAGVGVDAFVVTGTHHGDPRGSWLAHRGLAFVTFGRPWDGPAAAVDPAPAHPWVDVDCAAGTDAATTHLLRRGHDRIGFVGWPPGSGTGDDRRTGWRRALRRAGRPVGPARLDPFPDVPSGPADGAVVPAWITGRAAAEAATPDGVPGGRAAAAALLQGPDAPTAFVCASDSLALGVLAELRARDLPRDGVIGFDDTPVADALGLSSVRQPITEAATACMRQLRTLLDGTPHGSPLHGGPSPQHAPLDDTGALPRPVLLTPDLIVRRPG